MTWSPKGLLGCLQSFIGIGGSAVVLLRCHVVRMLLSKSLMPRLELSFCYREELLP